MRLIVGLGNPGTQYTRTRHNIGFRVLDSLDLNFQKGFNGLYAKACGNIYLKPQTFMNLSGKSVLPALSFFKLKPEDTIVIHDEIDLPFGTIKTKKSGGHAGHNGLRDITQAIGPDFYRIRIGVGKPEIKAQVASYVLAPFSPEEESKLPEIIELSQLKMRETLSSL